MNTSDVIQIISACAAFILSAVAIWQSHKAIKLTEKSILDANRPYIACYLQFVDVGFFQKYFIVKNFGNTPAQIINIVSTGGVTTITDGTLDSLSNTILAPGQSFVSAFNNQEDEELSITVNYEDIDGTLYNDTFKLNPNFSDKLAYHRVSSSSLSKDQNDLRNALHSMAKQNL